MIQPESNRGLILNSAWTGSDKAALPPQSAGNQAENEGTRRYADGGSWIPAGTNIFHLRTPAANGPTYRGRLEAAGISVPPDIDGGSFMQVNETWARMSAEEIAARLRRALGEPDDRITRAALARAGSVPSR